MTTTRRLHSWVGDAIEVPAPAIQACEGHSCGCFLDDLRPDSPASQRRLRAPRTSQLFPCSARRASKESLAFLLTRLYHLMLANLPSFAVVPRIPAVTVALVALRQGEGIEDCRLAASPGGRPNPRRPERYRARRASSRWLAPSTRRLIYLANQTPNANGFFSIR